MITDQGHNNSRCVQQFVIQTPTVIKVTAKSWMRSDYVGFKGKHLGESFLIRLSFPNRQIVSVCVVCVRVCSCVCSSVFVPQCVCVVCICVCLCVCSRLLLGMHGQGWLGSPVPWLPVYLLVCVYRYVQGTRHGCVTREAPIPHRQWDWVWRDHTRTKQRLS